MSWLYIQKRNDILVSEVWKSSIIFFFKNKGGDVYELNALCVKVIKVMHCNYVGRNAVLEMVFGLE